MNMDIAENERLNTSMRTPSDIQKMITNGPQLRVMLTPVNVSAGQTVMLSTSETRGDPCMHQVGKGVGAKRGGTCYVCRPGVQDIFDQYRE